jgi:hypothetical protein
MMTLDLIFIGSSSAVVAAEHSQNALYHFRQGKERLLRRVKEWRF